MNNKFILYLISLISLLAMSILTKINNKALELILSIILMTGFFVPLYFATKDYFAKRKMRKKEKELERLQKEVEYKRSLVNQINKLDELEKSLDSVAADLDEVGKGIDKIKKEVQ